MKMDYSVVQEGARRLTPAQANFVVSNMAYERQRPIAKDHVTTLRELMQRDQWNDRSPLDFARLPGGQIVLVNGHHRLTAQAQSHRDIVWQIIIRDCADMDAVAALYYRYDTNARTRSEENILAGINYADRHGLSKSMAKNLYRAAPIIAAGLSMRNSSDADITNRRLVDERLQIMDRYVVSAQMAAEAFDPAPTFVSRKLAAGGFFAVVLVTYFHQPATADRFWRGMVLDDGLAKGDPRKTLLNDIRDRDSRKGVVLQNVVSATKAWSAFFESRKLMIIRVKAGETIPLLGTPYVVRP